MSLRPPGMALAQGLVVVLLASGASVPAAGAQPSSVQRTGDRGVKIVAAGDIACLPGAATTATTCRQGATARLAARLDPTAVLALGDTQYDVGAFSAYRHSYDLTWGALRPVTRPVPGNHEYGTPNARGYYRYFRQRQPGPPGWYAYRLGAWRLYALNSECDAADCEAQLVWLLSDLASHPRACSLMYLHRPRYSSGSEHGSDPSVRALREIADEHGVDVALAGHEHNYERFVRMDAAGNPSGDGIQSFVVGTGGKSLYPFGAVESGSVVRYNDDFGVLALGLRRRSYAWRFKTIGGQLVDSGSRSCV